MIFKAPPLIFPRFPAAQILGWGAGGKTRGLWDCGIVAKSRFLKFPDFSCFCSPMLQD